MAPPGGTSGLGAPGYRRRSDQRKLCEAGLQDQHEKKLASAVNLLCSKQSISYFLLTICEYGVNFGYLLIFIY